MYKYITGKNLSPRLALTLKGIAFGCVGFIIGEYRGKNRWDKIKDWYNDDHMTKYECQDQINKLIDETQKPAVVYYYLPNSVAHNAIRSYMYKFSNLYPNNANWIMINLTKHLQQARYELETVYFPDCYLRIEVRFKKSDIAIFSHDESGQTTLIDQRRDYRREVYNANASQEEFKRFLEFCGVIEGDDPMKTILQTTQKAIFSE